MSGGRSRLIGCGRGGLPNGWSGAVRRCRRPGKLSCADFLSDLATRQRAAVATQRQALNALVFLMREALGKPLADFSEFDAGAAWEAAAGGVEPRGVPAVAGGAGGDAAVDGGVDVWQRGAADGAAAAAGKGCGFGTAAIGHPGGQGREGPGDGAAEGVAGAVAGSIGSGCGNCTRRIRRRGRRGCGCRRGWSGNIPTRARRGNGSGFFPRGSVPLIRKRACSGGIMCRMRRFKTPSARRRAGPN